MATHLHLLVGQALAAVPEACSPEAVEITVTRLERAEATGIAKKIYDAMKEPVDLYVAMIGGQRLRWFVIVDGVWRTMGKILPPAGSR